MVQRGLAQGGMAQAQDLREHLVRGYHRQGAGFSRPKADLRAEDAALHALQLA